MRQYKVISADDHVQEASDAWTKRVPAKFRDRAPRIERGPDGDAWVIDGKRGRSIGGGVQAGKKFEEYNLKDATYATIRPGSYDPVERLKDMDMDGIDAQILYPNIIHSIYKIKDIELQLACIRAYNDFLSDFCSVAPDRLIGVGAVPTDDVAAGVEEIKHIAKLPNMRGLLLPTYPQGEPLNSDIYDPLWAEAQELGLPMHIHLRTGDPALDEFFGINGPGSRPRVQFPEHLHGNSCIHMATSSMANYVALAQVIFGGVLERFPRVKFVSAEGNIGWLGYFLEKCDFSYRRDRHWSKLNLPLKPSEYFRRQVLATFIEDKVGVMLRNFIGLDNLMWSSDYPHKDTTFPNSQKYLNEVFEGVPEDERYKILAGNAVKLYNLN